MQASYWPGGRRYSLNNYVLLKSKQCSHNLQSNQQICLLIILWITKDWWFWDKNWKREIEGGTISLYCSLVIHKCIDIMPLFRQHITAQGHIIGNIDKVNNSLLHNCDTCRHFKVISIIIQGTELSGIVFLCLLGLLNFNSEFKLLNWL